jgi:DNA-binding beta-propeller fold protein YncE
MMSLLCAAAACGSSAPAGSSGQPAKATAGATVGTVSHSVPGCTRAAQPGPALADSATTTTTLVPTPPHVAPGPFGVATTAAGNWGWAFASSLPISSVVRVRISIRFAGSPSPSPSPTPSPPPGSGDSGLAVLRLIPGHAPVLVHTVAVPGPAAGDALSPNGRLLLVAGGAGAAVVSVPAAEQGSKHAVLGTLVAPGQPESDAAVEAAFTPDGRYAFVSLQGAGQIAVFNLARAMTRGFKARGVYVGSIPARDAIGLAVSPDGRWLYATTLPQTGPAGLLSVISVATAESDPAKSVVAQAPAGCTPVRVITSADGSVVWVTATESNALLAFSAARLQTDPAHALLADVRVGQAPIGLALARGGQLIVVADSNRFAPGFPASNLAVVKVSDALAGRPALVGFLRSGRFPRSVAASADGSLVLVANFASGQVEAVNAAALP